MRERILVYHRAFVLIYRIQKLRSEILNNAEPCKMTININNAIKLHITDQEISGYYSEKNKKIFNMVKMKHLKKFLLYTIKILTN